MFIQFAGTNSFYHILKDARGPSQQTIGRTIRRVTEALFDLKDDIIRWPNNTDKMVSDFYNISGFPSVAGCLDGTHVDVIAPGTI